jgi:hypothetical protein
VESTVMITVWAGSSPPPPLESLRVPELAHLEVFASRSSEEGRQRYRLHLGYFVDSTAATRVLPRVREMYPSAWVVPASRHRPLARLKVQAMPGTSPLEPAPPAKPDETVVLKPFARRDLSDEMTDEVSVDMAAILALLQEESDPPTPSISGSVANDSAVRTPAAITAKAEPALPDLFNALSRLIVEEWHPQKALASGGPAARSWLKRLPRLIRG